MKTFNAVLRVLAALAAVAGAIYLVATYGERIVAWCRQIWSRMPQCPVCEEAEAVQETETEIPAETEMPEEAAAEEIAGERGIAVSQVCLAYLLGLSDEIFPIINPSKEEHMKENIEALNVTLTDEEISRLMCE